MLDMVRREILPAVSQFYAAISARGAKRKAEDGLGEYPCRLRHWTRFPAFPN